MPEHNQVNDRPLLDNGMDPWEADEAECIRIEQVMAARGIGISRGENVGVSLDVAIDILTQVANGDVDVTRDIDDSFANKTPC